MRSICMTIATKNRATYTWAQLFSNYIANINRGDKVSVNVDGISNLTKNISNLTKNKLWKQRNIWISVGLSLLKLTLVLPVTTMTVEIYLSSMKYLKMDLRNSMSVIWIMFAFAILKMSSSNNCHCRCDVNGFKT